MRHGSNLDPRNRFESVHLERDLAQLDPEDEDHAPRRDIEFIDDQSQTIVSENKSPDIPFRYSLNPYRGCIHGCAYCYARNTHEYLGFNAGLDFETKIVVKRNAAELLRRFLARPQWQPEPIMFSGVTDCYQPAESTFGLTRRCLEVALTCRQPVQIITKNALVLRDTDLLVALAKQQLVHVFLSITTLQSDLASLLEPRTSIPAARLRAVRSLADAGVPVGVMIAPIIPRLNDSEIPEVMAAAAQAGAQATGYVLLRLPQSVEPVFIEWLQRTQPLRAEAVIQHIRATRGGSLNQSGFGHRMSGTGEMARQIKTLFQAFRKKHQLDQPLADLDCSQFRPPQPHGQMLLF